MLGMHVLAGCFCSHHQGCLVSGKPVRYIKIFCASMPRCFHVLCLCKVCSGLTLCSG